MKQTYDNYHRLYFKTVAGREAKNRAQRKYRQKLARTYGCGWAKAAQLKRQSK